MGERVLLGGVPVAPDALPAGLTGGRKLRVAHDIQAGEGGPQVRVLSAVVDLEILAPSSEDDRAALALLADPEAAAVYQLRWSVGQEAVERGIRKLEDLVSLHPASAYAPAAAFTAGEHYFSIRREVFTQGSERLPDGSQIPKVREKQNLEALAKAEMHFGTVISKSSDPGLLLRARLRLAELALDRGQRKAADAHLDAADVLDEDLLLQSDRSRLRALISASR